MTYAGLAFATDNTAPHLGGNVTAGDPFTFCPLVWDYLISRFGIETMMDLGSGSGNTAWYFHKKGVRVIAVDGLAANVKRSLYPAIMHDLTAGPVSAAVDLVHCQEVVEHIEEQFVDNLIISMLSGRVIVMTHALPGQGGYHHVNLQPPEYWILRFAERGATLLEEDTRRVRQLATSEGGRFMAATGLVFANNNRF